MKSIFIFILSFIIMIFFFWYGGVDFLERDLGNSYLLFVSFTLATMISVLTKEIT